MLGWATELQTRSWTVEAVQNCTRFKSSSYCSVSRESLYDGLPASFPHFACMLVSLQEICSAVSIKSVQVLQDSNRAKRTESLPPRELVRVENVLMRLDRAQKNQPKDEENIGEENSTRYRR
ncbi:unnamed protein product [Sphacelaria rigidula]